MEEPYNLVKYKFTCILVVTFFALYDYFIYIKYAYLQLS